MSTHSFFASPAQILAGFWSSDPRGDRPVGHRYREPSTLLRSSISADARLHPSAILQRPPILLPLPPYDLETHRQPFRRPEEYREAVVNIERALESANTAINDAQEALQIRNTRSAFPTAMPPLVDLTATSPNESPDIHRHDDSQPGRSVRSHISVTGEWNEPPTNGTPPRSAFARIFHDAGRVPRISAAMQAFSVERPNDPAQHRYLAFPGSFVFTGERADLADQQEREQQAIRRQREARALWESNHQRREAYVPRRSRSRSPRQTSPPVRQRSEDQTRPRSSSPQLDPGSPVESIDLTAVDEKTTAAEFLAKQQADVVASQKTSWDTGRTALTAYKCPICMEVPTDITATICGHLFCHRCIIETLKWSEDQRADNAPGHRPKGVCPVCRKEMRRVDTDVKGRTLVPLSLMLGQQARKQQKIDVKGKGVARAVTGTENRKRESSSEWMSSLVNLEDE